MTTVATRSLATAELLLDRSALSAIVGAPVRAERLRHKPGLSTIAALVADDAADPRVRGWVQACQPGHLDKVRNAVRRAGTRGRHLHVHRDEGTGLVVVRGGLDTDPRLVRGLDPIVARLGSVEAAVGAGTLTVLRYNPQRRLVLRRQIGGRPAQVLRVMAEKRDSPRSLLTSLRDAGVPVLLPVAWHDLGHSRRVTVWPWYGNATLADGDLDPRVAAVAARAAGEALAQVHEAPVGGASPWTPTREVVRLAAQLDALRGLDPASARRAEVLAARALRRIEGSILRADPTRRLHGDFSADQVLWGDDGVALIDFDRAEAGPPAADLGSFVAAELVVGEARLTRDLLAGYAVGGGAEVPDDVLAGWVARSLLLRAVEPFRAGHPDWAARVGHRLDQVEEVLDR